MDDSVRTGAHVGQGGQIGSDVDTPTHLHFALFEEEGLAGHVVAVVDGDAGDQNLGP